MPQSPASSSPAGLWIPPVVSSNAASRFPALHSAVCVTASFMCSRRLTVFRDGHRLNDCGEFLSLPRKYFELPLCILVGEREEFHRRLCAQQLCDVLDSG